MDGTADQLLKGMDKCQLMEREEVAVMEEDKPAAASAPSTSLGSRMGGSDDKKEGPPAPPRPEPELDQSLVKKMVRELSSERLERIFDELLLAAVEELVRELKEREVGGTRAFSSPFELFPEEVWERILEELYLLMDSQDILNLFKAFPEMEGLFLKNKNKFTWLFDQVIPHVFPWLGLERDISSEKALLTCRQVCKHWCRGVDNFVENHPQRRAYDHESQITGQLWTPVASPAYYDFSNLDFVWNFTGSEQFIKAERNMTGHPPWRNPFVGRSILLNGIPERTADRRLYWARALEFLRKFGLHIWFLEIRVNYNGCFEELCRFVLGSLALLPKLKGLEISFHNPCGWYASDEETTLTSILDSHQHTLSRLPHLETLSISGCCCYSSPNCQADIRLRLPKGFINFLLMSFSGSLRKLDICACFWGPEFSPLFPELTQFSLNGCEGKKTVTDILMSLTAPGLFGLTLFLESSPINVVIGRDIVSWLRRFPGLNAFKLEFGFENKLQEEMKKIIDEDKSLPSPTISTTSLKSLTISSHHFEINFDFLQCCPALEYIKIRMSSTGYYLDRPSSIQLLYGCKIWKMLPKLKEISLPPIRCWNSRRWFMWSDFHFSRAKYDWLNERMAQASGSGSALDIEGLSECFKVVLARSKTQEEVQAVGTELGGCDCTLASGDDDLSENREESDGAPELKWRENVHGSDEEWSE